MVSTSLNNQKYSRYPLVLKLNVALARPLRLVILYFFEWKILSDDRRLYLHDNKWNSKFDVDGLTHTKQLLNLLCIVIIVTIAGPQPLNEPLSIFTFWCNRYSFRIFL